MFFDVNNIIKISRVIRFDGCQHICLIRVFAHADFNSSAVEGFRIFVILRARGTPHPQLQ